MAAFAQASPRAPTPAPAGRARSSSLLPDGQCSFRNLAFDANAPSCGCKRFWLNHNLSPTDPKYPACICGHHACFHDTTDHVPAASFNEQPAAHPLNHPGNLINVGPGGYIENQARRSQERSTTPRQGGRRSQNLTCEKTVEYGQQSVRDFAAAAGGLANPPAFLRRDKTGSPRSGFPNVPSVCELNSSDLRPLGADPNPYPRPEPSRLGTPMSTQITTDRLNKMLAPNRADLNQWHRALEQTCEDSQLASTVAYSTDGESERPRNSPSRAFLDYVLQSRRAATQLEVPQTTENPDDVVQSATELATPSVSGTPVLKAYDHHLQETGSLINSLYQELNAAENANAPADLGNELITSPTQINTSQLTPKPAANRTPDTGAESLNSVQRNVPTALRRLAPQLLALQRHLSQQPDVSTAIQNLSDRIYMLENASFSNVPADEVHDKFELMDGRLLDVEHRLIDMEQQNAIKEAEREQALVRRDEIEEGSVRSDGSMSSAALMAAAMGSAEHKRRLDEIELRLDDLESDRPSPAHPWEVEVVLLPWGQDLKGIWFTQDDLDRNGRSMSGNSLTSEDTQSLFGDRTSKSSFRLMDSEHPGWTDEAISDWAGNARQLLFPKAPGPNSLVWHRLESRGLIRKVSLTGHSGRQIMMAIERAFGSELLNQVCDCSKFLDAHQVMDGHQTTDGTTEELSFIRHAGLRAPVIPLRKIPKDPQLLFLPHHELLTPAQWDADFLASDVMMRVSGNRKRLYVTVSDAYVQAQYNAPGLNWKKIRDLPEVNVDSDSQDSQIEDTRWEFNPNTDQPYSELSSFSNNASQSQSIHESQLSSSFESTNSLPVRSATEQEPTNSRPTNVSARPKDPLTPQPELSRQRSSSSRRYLQRTVSAPTTFEDPTRAGSKRRATNSFDLIEEIQPPHSLPGPNAPAYTNTSSGSRKRRRMLHPSPPASDTRSSGTTSAAAMGGSGSGNSSRAGSTAITTNKPFSSSGVQQGPCGFTPRRSREPSDPYTFMARAESSQARSISAAQAMSVMGYAGGAAKGNSPSAYATPHSGTAGGPPEPTFEPDGGNTEGDTEPDSGDEEEWKGDAEMTDFEGCATDADEPEEEDVPSQVDLVKSGVKEEEEEEGIEDNAWINCKGTSL